MRGEVVALVLVSLATSATAQKSPVAAPPPGQPAAAQNLNPGSSTTVTVAPDPAATAMADPQSAAEFGSPSAVDSPSTAMPNPAAWPTPKPSAKRPNWVKKAPSTAADQKAPPPPH
ncbi:MAG TPA: proteophosphoglycan 5 [Caulobacteraceae bacterium]|jgi:hypothetical protein